jgi:hypothetical protein
MNLKIIVFVLAIIFVIVAAPVLYYQFKIWYLKIKKKCKYEK